MRNKLWIYLFLLLNSITSIAEIDTSAFTRIGVFEFSKNSPSLKLRVKQIPISEVIVKNITSGTSIYVPYLQFENLYNVHTESIIWSSSITTQNPLLESLGDETNIFRYLKTQVRSLEDHGQFEIYVKYDSDFEPRLKWTAKQIKNLPTKVLTNNNPDAVFRCVISYPDGSGKSEIDVTDLKETIRIVDAMVQGLIIARYIRSCKEILP